MASAVDSTIRIAFGLVHGFLLAMLFPLLYIFVPTYVKAMPLLALVLLLPILSYLSGFGLNALSQYIYCNKVSVPQVALVSTFAPAFVVGFSLLAYFLPVLRSPVESILPLTADVDMKYAMGFAFYLLWAGIYGQNIASGMLTACPAS
jgi:hypothetical protein